MDFCHLYFFDIAWHANTIDPPIGVLLSWQYDASI
jgi:hypothetical protein